MTIMDNLTNNTVVLPALFGTAALGTRLYFTFARPDAQGFRYGILAAAALWTTSYATQGNMLGTAFGATVVARSCLRSTKWGAGVTHVFNSAVSNRHLIMAGTLAAVGSFTAAQYQNWTSLMPLGAVTLGTIADTQSRGRIQRPISFGASLCALAFAVSSLNPGTIANECAGAGITLMGIIKHDFKNAAGSKSSLSKNLKAYFHGLFRKSATGASMASQVPINAGNANPQKIKENYLALPENPWFNRKFNALPEYGIKKLDNPKPQTAALPEARI